MSTTRRRIAIALSTTVLLIAGVFAGAAPASAASVSYKVYLKFPLIDGYNKSSILRGSGSGGDTLKVSMQFRYRAYSEQKAPKPKVTLQRKVGKKWTTIKTAKKGSNYSFSAKLPAYTVKAGKAKQVVKYRFKSTKSASRHVINTDYSKTFTVTYENQSLYTGLAAQVYQQLAPFCPAVAVRVDSGLAADQHAGEFIWTRGITVDPTIASYSPTDLRAVALHECAHYKQFNNFGASYTGDKKAQKASEKIFTNDVDPATGQPTSPVIGGFNPYEHAADCASHAVEPAGYLGYGGYCNPNELAAGLRLMQGKKY
jgi:hypothetical protein